MREYELSKFENGRQTCWDQIFHRSQKNDEQIEKLRYLAANVQISDFKPADSYVEVYEILKGRLNSIVQKFEKLKTEVLSNTLDTLRNNKIEMIVTD